MEESNTVPDIAGRDIDPRGDYKLRTAKKIARCSMLAFGEMADTDIVDDPNNLDNWLVEIEGTGACPSELRAQYEAAGMQVEDEPNGYVVYRRPEESDEV